MRLRLEFYDQMASQANVLLKRTFDGSDGIGPKKPKRSSR
jgi:hypothetical protein